MKFYGGLKPSAAESEVAGQRRIQESLQGVQMRGLKNILSNSFSDSRRFLDFEWFIK